MGQAAAETEARVLVDLLEGPSGTGGVASGDGIMIGALFGIASKTAAAGETVAIVTDGVFDLPKLASAVIAAGERVSWDNTAKQVNLPDSGRYPIGTAIEAAGNGATIVRVRLDGVATAAAAAG